MKTIMQLCDVVRQTSYNIHLFHSHGHLEKVYENALAHRLRKLGLDVKQQHAITVFDEDGTVIGEYNAEGTQERNTADKFHKRIDSSE